MTKLKKLSPEKISIAGHNVVVSEKVFKAIVDSNNAQINAINEIIDYLAEDQKDKANIKKSISEIKSATQTLAAALKLMTEE